MTAAHSPTAADEKHQLGRDSLSTTENDVAITKNDFTPLNEASEKRLLRKIDYKVSTKAGSGGVTQLAS